MWRRRGKRRHRRHGCRWRRCDAGHDRWRAEHDRRHTEHDGGTQNTTGGTPDIGTICANAGAAKDGQCKAQAEGVYALKVEVPVWWDFNDVVDAGRGNITTYLIGEISDICQDGSGGLGTLRACGAELPVFQSDTTCDAYQGTFDTAIWDNWATMPTFTTTGSTTGFEPGDVLTLNAATGLLGMALPGGNADGAWPAATYETFSGNVLVTCDGFDGTAASCYPDHDGDGMPGVTLTMADTGEAYNDSAYPCTGGNWVVNAPPVDLLQGAAAGGGSGAGIRAPVLNLGMRLNVGGSGAISATCDSGTGVGESAYVDSRLVACIKRGAERGTPAVDNCLVGEAEFMDVRLPKFVPLAEGEAPPAGTTYNHPVLAMGTPMDLTPSPGAISRVVRLGDLGATSGDFGGFNCAAVRGANFPD